MWIAAAIVCLTCFQEATSGWDKLGATLIHNCAPNTDLTPTGVEELILAGVTGLIGVLLARSWARTGAASRVWLIVPLTIASLLTYGLVDLPSGYFPAC